MRMIQSPSSSSSSSLDSREVPIVAVNKIKFLCSYGGQILPRRTDGKLCYVGGDTRVLAVDSSISFQELELKVKKLCGWTGARLRCRLPTEDLDTLVSVTSDEDLANLIEEYRASTNSPPLKIRAFLYPPEPIEVVSDVVGLTPGMGPMVRRGSPHSAIPSTKFCGRYASPCYRYNHSGCWYLRQQ